jgi:Cu-Zn family superoxide dismutase
MRRHPSEEIAVMKLLTTGIALLALAPLSAAAATPFSSHTLPDATAFPESIGVDARTGAFFTGSLIDGAVYRGTLDAPDATVFLPAGSYGRTNVAGVKVDGDGRIWIADAFNGRVLVYDQSAQLLHSFVLAGLGSPTVNDIAFSRGVAYVTDSSRPFLYRIEMTDADTPGTSQVEPWLDVSGSIRYTTGEGPFGVNLNGIVAAPDGRTLLAVQTNTGLLFRIDVASGHVSRVDVDGAELLFADGMLRLGDDLYIARNAANEILRLRIGPDWHSAETVSTFTTAQLAFPTALAELRGRLLVTNSQLNAASDPTLPFNVLDLPLTLLGHDDR